MPTVDQVGQAQGLVEKSPLAFVAAFFALAFFALLVWHLRSERRNALGLAAVIARNAAELASVNDDRLNAEEEHTRQLVAILSNKRLAPRPSRKALPLPPEVADEEPDAEPKGR